MKTYLKAACLAWFSVLAKASGVAQSSDLEKGSHAHPCENDKPLHSDCRPTLDGGFFCCWGGPSSPDYSPSGDCLEGYSCKPL